MDDEIFLCHGVMVSWLCCSPCIQWASALCIGCGVGAWGVAVMHGHCKQCDGSLKSLQCDGIGIGIGIALAATSPTFAFIPLKLVHQVVGWH